MCIVNQSIKYSIRYGWITDKIMPFILKTAVGCVSAG